MCLLTDNNLIKAELSFVWLLIHCCFHSVSWFALIFLLNVLFIIIKWSIDLQLLLYILSVNMALSCRNSYRTIYLINLWIKTNYVVDTTFYWIILTLLEFFGRYVFFSFFQFQVINILMQNSLFLWWSTNIMLRYP